MLDAIAADKQALGSKQRQFPGLSLVAPQKPDPSAKLRKPRLLHSFRVVHVACRYHRQARPVAAAPCSAILLYFETPPPAVSAAARLLRGLGEQPSPDAGCPGPVRRRAAVHEPAGETEKERQRERDAAWGERKWSID